MKSMKKILALILSLVICFSTMAVAVYAAPADKFHADVNVAVSDTGLRNKVWDRGGTCDDYLVF